MGRKILSKSEDAAGVGPYARERARLVPLGALRGWNVMDGEADIRSWEVKTISGRLLGSVRELLVDAKAGEVVMIDVDLAASGDHAYVPLRVVEIDRTRRVVRADSADLEIAQSDLPAEDRARLSEAELARVRRDVHYAHPSRERVIERRPTVEETVVRRRTEDKPETRL